MINQRPSRRTQREKENEQVKTNEPQDLVKRLLALQSREEAFRELVELYQVRIYWLVRKFVIDHEDANDVVQNTFIKAFKGLDRFRGEAQIFTWLHRIATNESLTFLKKSAKHNASDLDLAKTLEADSYFDGDEAQMRLQMALITLPPKQRVVFNMKYFENMSYRQISDILETSVGALKASYHHAVKKIEAYIRQVEV